MLQKARLARTSTRPRGMTGHLVPGLLTAILGLLPGLAVATSAPFSGTLSFRISSFEPVVVRGLGYVTVNAAASGDLYPSIEIPAGTFARAGSVLFTDPASFPVMGIDVHVSNGFGSFAPDGTMPVDGVLNLCLFGGCAGPAANVVIPLLQDGTRGVGIGGGPMYSTGVVDVTVQGAPWTMGTVSIGPLSATGFVRGLASDGIIAVEGAELQLVTPIMISTNIGASAIPPSFGILNLKIAPPSGPDTDSDGIPDFVDNCPLVPNRGWADDDQDGVGDACDNCPAVPNANQLDTNQDGLGDACTDTDSDGAADSVDNCPAVSNSDQWDSDHDGIGNACDNCPYVANADQLDTDQDGIADACRDTDSDGAPDRIDNCPLVPNPGSADDDRDGVGNACDNCPYVANADQLDTDQDGSGDACDNCPTVGNTSQQDTDADGAGDSCDNCTLVRNGPLLRDSGGFIQRDTDNDCYGNVCDPDLNNDGIVNFVDLAALKSRFYSGDPGADLDGSGFVNYTDLSLLKRRMFKAPGPSGITSVCVPEGPPCTVEELSPLLLCGAEACFEPGTPASCILQQCEAAYDALKTRCRSCLDGLPAPVAAVWLDLVVPHCAQ